MAQCIMQQIVDEDGCSDRYLIDSKATSTEEIGNGIYPPAKKKLEEMNTIEALLNDHHGLCTSLHLFSAHPGLDTGCALNVRLIRPQLQTGQGPQTLLTEKLRNLLRNFIVGS